MKTYELNLSEEDFTKMSKNLIEMADKLDRAKELILRGLAEYTHERVLYYIATSVGLTDYVGTDELINSIQISPIYGDTIQVFTDNAYAVFVEYGTGMKGAGSAYPELPSSVTAFGKSYSSYNSEYTGQVAHKFMYNAFQDLQQNYLEIAKNILKKEGII